MDKDILTQYSDMVEEIKDLRRRIRKNQEDIDRLEDVKDSVKGTKRDGTIGNITVEGFPSPRYRKLSSLLWKKKALLQIKEEELVELTGQAEEYINSIGSSRIRRIMRYRYIDGLNWQQVANRMGGDATAEGCRKAHDRFLSIDSEKK